ncbi:uncharacterized protein [Aegilops tauschii subsp. strangulata]|uniref:uncharacterized protein n=1 Tax=Aegilops tauschii subsp. strangulata TaxID=200361 RepID=UPI00098A57E7|nr:uncharacterized protein LOC109749598 [Aegilops tauschii subsp. strangulata]
MDPGGGAGASAANLPVDMLANIHGRLSLLDFAAAFRSSRGAFRPEAPCLVLPGDTPDTVTLFSLSGRHAISVRAPEPTLLDHIIMGSSPSRGWLVTADDRARLRLLNPVTGERRSLPAITTIPCLHATTGGENPCLTLDLKWFFRGPPLRSYGPVTMTADTLRRCLYRKVVLSDSGAIAMLITGLGYGAVAFATAGGGSWRLAPPRDGVEPIASPKADPWSLGPSPDGVEDAVHHEGRFYSITCSGKMEESRQQDADIMFASTVVEPALRLVPADTNNCKYLLVTPGGRLMVVLKTKETTGWRTPLSFKVQVLGAGAKEWKETDDIGDPALFVGTKGSLCVSTREHPELRAGCVYYAAHGGVVVLSLKGGTVKEVDGLWTDHSWLEWFTPCISR